MKTETKAIYFAMGVKAFCIEHLKKEGDKIIIHRSDLERLQEKIDRFEKTLSKKSRNESK